MCKVEYYGSRSNAISQKLIDLLSRNCGDGFSNYYQYYLGNEFGNVVL